MEGSTHLVQQGGVIKDVEIDYLQRIMHSLTDTHAVPSQTSQIEPGDGPGFHGFYDSYGRIPDISPGLNPWSFVSPPPELRCLLPSESTESEPSWETASPDQREALADFSWFTADTVEQRRMYLAGTNASEVISPRFSNIKTSDEVGLTTRGSQDDLSDVCASTCPLDTPTDQVAWVQSVLELQAFEGSHEPGGDHLEPQKTIRHMSSATCSAARHLVDGSHSGTPITSESLSSSLVSDGETEFKNKKRKTEACSGDVAETSGRSEKRVRSFEEEEEDGEDRDDVEEDGDEDARSDDQETKEPMASVVCRNRPRKKGGVKRVREPRYAIKTRADTDVLDDGYKWRKYGQKAVKNSPHPRNYYRCTTPNCPVRKRVERCIEDPGLVATTYEGTHTHQSPSFLRCPPGFPGGLPGLLATLSHHYSMSNNPALEPPFSGHSPFSLSDLLFRSSMLLPHEQAQGLASLRDSLNLLRAHELLRLQQEAAWASIKSEPFQLGAHDLMSRHQEGRPTNFPRPSFSNVSSLSNQSQLYDSLSSAPEQQGGFPLEYNSLINGAAPFSAEQPFVLRPEYFDRSFSAHRAALSRESSVPTDAGLLEDILKPTNATSSRA